MTPEERFARIETNLERLEQGLNELRVQVEKSHRSHDSNMGRIEINMERIEVEFEKNQHAHELRYQRLTEMQAVLMESQNDTWKAIDRLTANVEKLVRGRGPNGQGN